MDTIPATGLRICNLIRLQLDRLDLARESEVLIPYRLLQP